MLQKTAHHLSPLSAEDRNKDGDFYTQQQIIYKKKLFIQLSDIPDWDGSAEPHVSTF